MKSSFVYSAVLTALVLANSAFAEDAKAPHWAYSGEHNPAHWAELSPAFETCAKGKSQSPVNIDKTVKANLPALDFHYAKAAPLIVNNGHTVQVNVPAGSTLKVGDQNYELVQFHFHTPSEETIHGKHQPMEAHFVHHNAAGALAVVSILIQRGKTNPFYAPIFDHLPRPSEKITVDDLVLDLASMLPTERGYYAFSGSLTTPPCSEGVSWMVLKQPISLGEQQIKAFQHLFKADARPTQALNGREIQESQ